MADALSPTELDMNKLLNGMIQYIKYFAQISNIRIKDNEFIQEKINQISKQREAFREFAEKSISQSHKMCGYAENLIVFVECCEDGTSKEDLMESLSSLLSDSKSYKTEATSLKEQIITIKNSLGRIAEEISDYDVKITEERKNLSNNINKANKLTNDAKSNANNGKIVAGIGFTIATASFPLTRLTGRASLVVLVFSSLATISGAVTFYITDVETSSNESTKLNHQLDSVKQFSQYLQEMRNGLDKITEIITLCEHYWEKQMSEIEGIITQLVKGERRIMKPLVRGILTKARRTLAYSDGYSFNMRRAINRDLIA